MTGPRIQQAPLPGPQPLQPQAQPVNTYYTPQMDPVAKPVPRTGLQQLGEALGTFSKAIDSFNDKKAKETQARAIAEGERLATLNKVSFKEATEKGIIPQGANPWIKHGYDRQYLTSQVLQYDQQLRTSWATDPVKDTDDTNAFNTFLSKQRDAFLTSLGGNYDPVDFRDTVLKRINQSEQSLQAEHINYRQKQRVEQAKSSYLETTDRLFVGALQRADKAAEGLTDHTAIIDARGRSLQAEAAAIQKNMQDASLHGLSDDDVQKMTVDAVFNVATRLSRDDLLGSKDGDGHIFAGIMDYIKVKQGDKEVPLSQTKHALEKIDDIAEQIYERRSRHAFNDEKLDYIEKKKRAEELDAQITTALLTDPRTDVTQQLQELTKVDPNRARSIAQFQHTQQTRIGDVPENAQMVSKMTVAAHENRLPLNVITSQVGVSIRPETAQKLITIVTSKQEEDKRNPLASATRNKALNDTIKSLTYQRFPDPKLAVFGDEGKKAQAKRDGYAAQLYELVSTYSEKHPDASVTDILRQVKDYHKLLFGDGPQPPPHQNVQLAPKPPGSPQPSKGTPAGTPRKAPQTQAGGLNPQVLKSVLDGSLEKAIQANPSLSPQEKQRRLQQIRNIKMRVQRGG